MISFYLLKGFEYRGIYKILNAGLLLCCCYYCVNKIIFVHVKGKYAVIIFENMATYTDMAAWNKEVLDKYCKDYEAGVLFFMKPQKTKGYKVENKDSFTQVSIFARACVCVSV